MEALIQSVWFQWIIMAVVAFLYAAVGHGGASGYLALMAIIGVEGSLMRSSALILNIFVSMTSFVQYFRRRYFEWALFWPFAVASVPMSFLGALLPITDSLYKKLLAVALLIAIGRMLFQPAESPLLRKPPLWAGLLVGAGIGVLSGMLGIGGGIILTPMMMLFGWGKIKEIAAVSALFILVNSISGLAGLLLKGFSPTPQTFVWLSAALVGGLAGAYYGSKHFRISTLRYILALVLMIACLKLYFT